MRESCRVLPNRRLSAILVALLAVSLVPGALAQSTLTVTASPDRAEAAPGHPVLFSLVLRNDGLVAESVTLGFTNVTEGWAENATLSNTTLTVEAGATANVTLTLVVPANAEANSTGAATVATRRAGTDIAAAPPVTVTVDVLAPPPAPAAGEPEPPRLALLAPGASAHAGDIARGFLTITNADARTLGVRIAVTGDAAWSPRVDDLTFYRLHPDETREILLAVTVPAQAETNSSRTFDVVVTTDVDATKFRTAWRVTSLGPAPSSTTNETAEADGDATATPSETPQEEAPAAPEHPVVALDAESISVPVGSRAMTTMRVSNPTLSTFTMTLRGEAPEGWVVRIEPDTVGLRPGESTNVAVTLEAPADAVPGGRGVATVIGRAPGFAEQRAAITILPTANAALAAAPADEPQVEAARVNDPGVPDRMSTAAVAAVGLGAVGAGALVLARRPWRENLVWVGVGLYTRLLRPDILRHEEREKLHGLIQAQPGIHFHALQRELDWNTGTLTYHVRVLERHSFITSRRDGLLRRFYVVGAAPRQETFEGPSGLRADVLEAIRNQPGMSQSDLTLALGANKQTVNYHVKALERMGQLRIEKRGRDTFLYPSNEPTTVSGVASA